MKIMSVSEAKMKLSSLVDEVSRVDAHITITKNGKPAAMLINPEEFESWEETIAILRDKKLMRDLRKSLKQIKEGKGKIMTLDEIFGE
ncbi:MAG TPA: type II toxin-antitoxin system Phd/YefM family antitoxin [Deltaproteobacteria bacterium]|nr:MAG: prevent-host-death protein [Deltaproteobacteria bacterium GWA2_45_12]HBF13745.1 type II toxin-antitoxin system Phd/YefM family antitoxin [Deltaproteobacteria bacterium]